ncbi:MAG: replicative DNA helicase [Bacteroidales bacterium]|nr:replicative DNA helicase [Bacteroidales bacterium]MBQ6556584.1 replicative DNA helicase [Bacteroidales bacterium]MBR0084601.1 replicative DNA helicase [Bacteroidales bacterium]MBR0290780.1 replicative DNA helicase [Bacteroidales bacterium]
MPESNTRTSRKRAQAANLDTIGLEMGNKPPQALDVEEAVLGAMLIEPSCVDQAMEELTASCFYDQKHRMIFEAMTSLVLDHTSIDIITVSNRLKEKGDLETVGGPVVLAGLSEKVGSAAHMEYYVKILKQKTIQRDLITASYDILKDAYDESVSVDDLIDKAQTKVYDAIQSNVRKEVQDIGSIINEAMGDIQEQQSSEGLSGVPSGFVSIDRITNGWQRSDLIILAARPSVGKTAFALNLARNAAVDHHMPVAVFSLEMSSKQLVKRLMTSESGLSADKIKGSVKLEPHEWEQLEFKLRNLSKAPFYIDDTPGMQIMEFRTKAKNLVKNKGVRLIVVDYLQLMQGPPELKAMREQEVAAISRTLKATAKELNIPIIALSQLSRQAVTRAGSSGKPLLSDLRESGSIEQDADMVIFIHRPDYVGLSENLEDREKTQIIIAKHRNGETRDIDMIFKSEQIRFMEMDEALDSLAARAVPSAINEDAPFEGASYGDFGPNPEF